MKGVSIRETGTARLTRFLVSTVIYVLYNTQPHSHLSHTKKIVHRSDDSFSLPPNYFFLCVLFVDRKANDV